MIEVELPSSGSVSTRKLNFSDSKSSATNINEHIHQIFLLVEKNTEYIYKPNPYHMYG